MTFQNPISSLFRDHPGMQCASGHQNISSCQHLENEWQKQNELVRRRNPYILSCRRFILSRRRRMNISLPRCHPSWYLCKRLNDWIHPVTHTLSRARIHKKLVSNWFHGKLAIGGDMSPLLMMWQALSSAQNSTPRQPFQAFRRWLWNMWSLVLSIIRCLWIAVPRMRGRPHRLIVGGMKKSPVLIPPRKTQTLHIPTFQW